MGPALSKDSQLGKSGSRKRRGSKKGKMHQKRPSILENPDSVDLLPEMLKEIYLYPGWNELFDPDDVVSTRSKLN